ncbi:DeoR/GlpR transcriptional regulator [Miniimonas arenae]|uniref:Lactose phosphotransferase system repressor n=1 Tax=Miniimonas arenae TaxID=676201 RepID=A0A5C5BBH5_9MICO|nr:DeoR/GlpR family DNA-binding transcription regulator [Miniimonas arenae]TNU73226.1 DeoR/GlpR transcriptional regulator [Miniimonas arenae]
MYATERQLEIRAIAREHGRVEVKELADRLGVTPETVRRDLTLLERRGVLRRVHGGAIAVERLAIEPAVADRETRMSEAKQRIARAALDELPDGGAIAVDAGTTTAQLVALMPADRELTVVTHGVHLAIALAALPGITLHLLGGQLRGRTLAAVGAWAEQQLADVHVDVAFVGANGVTVEEGITTPDLAEARIKRALVRAASRTVILADHTKFGLVDFARVTPLADVDTLITDTGLDAEAAAEIEATGCRVVRA